MNFKSLLLCGILVIYKISTDEFVQAESKLIAERIVQNGTIPNIDIVVSVIDKLYTNVNVTVEETIKERLLLNVFVTSLIGSQPKLLTKFTNFDFCRVLKSIGKGTVLKLLYRGLRQSTFIQSCPIQKGFYYLTNYKLDADAIPFRFLPAGKYLLHTELFTPGKSETDKRVSHRVDVYAFINLVRS